LLCTKGTALMITLPNLLPVGIESWRTVFIFAAALDLPLPPLRWSL
jgi:hypothetical protein